MAEREAKAASETRQTIETETGTETVQGLQLLFRWNAELTAFYTRRYQQYWALPQRLLSCATPEDVQRLQGQFLQQLAADYRDEAVKLSNIVGGPEQQPEAAAESAYAARLLDAQRDATAIIEQAKAQAERIVASAEKRASRPNGSRKTQTKKRA